MPQGIEVNATQKGVDTWIALMYIQRVHKLDSDVPRKVKSIYVRAYCSNLYTVTIGILAVNAMGIENAVDWSIITVICIIPAGKYLYCLTYLRPLILALHTTYKDLM